MPSGSFKISFIVPAFATAATATVLIRFEPELKAEHEQTEQDQKRFNPAMPEHEQIQRHQVEIDAN